MNYLVGLVMAVGVIVILSVLSTVSSWIVLKVFGASNDTIDLSPSPRSGGKIDPKMM